MPEKMMETLFAGAHPGHFNGLVEAGGVEAAQAFAHLVRVQGNTRLLRQLAGSGFSKSSRTPSKVMLTTCKAGPVEQQALAGILGREGNGAGAAWAPATGEEAMPSTSEP